MRSKAIQTDLVSLQRHFLARVEEGQAAPRRRPQPSSRILTAWKMNSANFAFATFSEVPPVERVLSLPYL